jgi:hypothetical protein
MSAFPPLAAIERTFQEVRSGPVHHPGCRACGAFRRARRGMLARRGRQRVVAHSSSCIARCVRFGGRARREARSRWTQRLAARALGQRLHVGEHHAAQAVSACAGAPLPVAGAVSSAPARRPGRRPSEQVAATQHRAPAWPRGLARTGGASAARSVSISRPQYGRCDRIRTAISCKVAPGQSLKSERRPGR